jgi:D-sedoheptulose 7-phosphate isomerase
MSSDSTDNLPPWLTDEIVEAAQLAAALQSGQALQHQLAGACAAVVNALKQRKLVLCFGNGGSAAQAEHLAEELSGRYRGDRPSLPGLALTASGSAMSCIANDYGYDEIFARQIEGFAESAAIAIAFSTSGNSPNVLRGLEVAREGGLVTIGMLGKGGGKAADLCDWPLVVPHTNTARIQEVHTLFLHLLCEAVEREIT